MPEEANQNANAPAPTAESAPTLEPGSSPAPAPAPAPAAAPTSAPASAPAPTELPPDLRIEVGTDDSGKPIEMTLREMADEALASRQAPKITDEQREQIEQMELVQKAVQGDDGAVARLREKYGVKTDDGLPEGVSKIITALQERIEGLESQVLDATAVTNQISTMKQEQGVKTLIDQHKDKLPFLARNPSGAGLVLGRLDEYRKLARANNVDIDNHPNAMRLMGHVLMEVDSYLKGQHALYHDWTPETRTDTADVQQPTDDQSRGPKMIPGARRFDSYGRPLPEQPDVPVNTSDEQIPRNVPQPVPGSHVGPGDATGTAGPYTSDGLRERLRRRNQAMAGGQ